LTQVTSQSTHPVLHGAVLGLGMIGRHHARLLQTSSRIAFAGAVDPVGDRHAVLQDPARLFATIPALLAAGPVDFAIVAVPTEEHLAAVEDAGLQGAVGHVERCNPALLELRRRLNAGEIGRPFLIATERIGPFPDRIRDVGVVKDLATHDLDLVRWLGGAPVAQVAAQTQHRMGREHEDLVLATGRLASDVSFNCVVDWLSPTKVRRTRVLGERGMFVADTLAADLTFYANGTVTSEWGAAEQARGVSEGDMTRYALSRREPLLVELEAFCDLLQGIDGAGAAVTLQEGLETVRCAEAVLRSAETGTTQTLGG
jgi:predicted dehydrogenase